MKFMTILFAAVTLLILSACATGGSQNVSSSANGTAESQPQAPSPLGSFVGGGY